MNGASQALQPGYLLAGKYRILRTLGVGGMGVVLAAHHELLGHPVAVKLLLGAQHDPEMSQRLLNEARAAAGIQSEHVVRVFDVNHLDDGTPFLVLEYLEGRDLAAEVEARGSLPYGEVAEHLVQAMQALAQAHASGIVHRDLKPSNLFLARRPDGVVVKVLDFGIAKDLSAAAQRNVALTRSRATLGSPLYMSPEQVRDSRAVDIRSDLWSVGAIIYELVAGQPPFDAETVGGVFAAILEHDVPPLHTRVPGVPRAFSDAVSRCLERDRQKRWASVGELAAALAPFAPNHGPLSLERIQRLARQSTPNLPLELQATMNATGPQATANGNWAGNVSATSSGRTAAVAIAAAAGTLLLACAGGVFVYKKAFVHGHDEPTTGAHPPAASVVPTFDAAPASAIPVAPTTAAREPAAPAVSVTPAANGSPATSVTAVTPLPPAVPVPPVASPPSTPPPTTVHRGPAKPPPNLSHDRTTF